MSEQFFFICVGFIAGWFWALFLNFVITPKKDSNKKENNYPPVGSRIPVPPRKIKNVTNGGK